MIVLISVAVTLCVGCCFFWVWKCRKDSKKSGESENGDLLKGEDELEEIQPMIMKKDNLDSNDWWKYQETMKKSDFMKDQEMKIQKSSFLEQGEDEDSNNTWTVYRVKY